MILGGNRIGDEGATAIGEALKLNGSLTSLDVGANDIEDEGAKAICEALKLNGSLTSLDVRENMLAAASKEQLRDVVKDRSGFKLKV